MAGRGSAGAAVLRVGRVIHLRHQFYLTENDVGSPRAHACVHKLAELNQHVSVHVHDGELSDDFIATFRVVVATETSLESQLALNHTCHVHGAAFIAVDTWGVLGSVFCDFGDAFEVEDTSGEPAIVRMVAGVSSAEEGVVAVVDTQRHGFSSDTMVAFSEVEGMPGINESPPRPIRITGPYSFTIGDTRNLGGNYGVGGWVREVKQPNVFRFLPLRESLEKPAFCETDWSKDSRAQHAAARALRKFEAQHEHLPRTHNDDDADEVGCADGMCCSRRSSLLMPASFQVFKLFQEVFDGPCDAHAEFVKSIARTARGKLCPMAAALGGIAAQEVIKACSRKFTPVVQWLYLDAREALPAQALSEDDVKPRGDRYVTTPSYPWCGEATA